MHRYGRNVGRLAQRATAAVIATVLVCGAASAQEVDFKDLPQEVQDAFGTIEGYFGQEIAIADFTTIDKSGASPEPGRAIVFNSKRVGKEGGKKIKVGKKVDLMEGYAEMTFVITSSPDCHLKQVGGSYYWVPRPPCP